MRIFKYFCRTVLRVVFLNLVGLMPVAAQSIAFGIKAGAPITDGFVVNDHASDLTNYSFNTQRYTFGPTFEVSLPYHLTFEADALYKRLRYVSYPFGFDSFRGTTNATSWEFPLLIKHYFKAPLHPYGSGGVSFRNITGAHTLFTNDQFQTTEEPMELTAKTTAGFTTGGGIDLAVGRIHFQPEIRYTRWGQANFSSSNGVLGSNLNSIDVLIGLTFHKE
jgi:opacity protein-like surface antigen